MPKDEDPYEDEDLYRYEDEDLYKDGDQEPNTRVKATKVGPRNDYVCSIATIPIPIPTMSTYCVTYAKQIGYVGEPHINDMFELGDADHQPVVINTYIPKIAALINDIVGVIQHELFSNHATEDALDIMGTLNTTVTTDTE